MKMIFNYHRTKYKFNNNNQINNLLLIARNQLLNNLYYKYDLIINNNNNNYCNNSIKKINRYKHIRNNYLNKYSYMSIELHSLFFIKL